MKFNCTAKALVWSWQLLAPTGSFVSLHCRLTETHAHGEALTWPTCSSTQIFHFVCWKCNLIFRCIDLDMTIAARPGSRPPALAPARPPTAAVMLFACCHDIVDTMLIAKSSFSETLRFTSTHAYFLKDFKRWACAEVKRKVSL